jgi:hypothetical protein
MRLNPITRPALTGGANPLNQIGELTDGKANRHSPWDQFWLLASTLATLTSGFLGTAMGVRRISALLGLSSSVLSAMM